MALAGAMIAGACSSTETTTLATDTDGDVPAAAADGATVEDTATEFDPVDTEPPPPATPTTTPGPLITPTPAPAVTSTVRPASTCPDVTVPQQPLFVWNVADDDPDGGLVAHTDADVDSPITRVLAPNALAARPTGNCKPAPNGAPWFELFDAATDQFDWVNARYLAPAAPACLHGEAFGSATRTGTLSGDSDTQLFGPLPGIAIAEGDVVAFLPNRDQLLGQAAPELSFRWFPADRITIEVPCFLAGASGPSCLSGTVVLFDFTDPEPRLSTDQPIDVDRTGRLYSRPAERGLRDDFVEVTLEDDPARYWYDPAATRATSRPCPADGSPPFSEINNTAFDALECTVDWGKTDPDYFSIGSADSIADHVHSITSLVDESSGCVRIVVAFGTDLWGDDQRPTNALPSLTTTWEPTSTRVDIDACGSGSNCNWFGADGASDIEVSQYGVRAFLARDHDGHVSIQVLHPTADANVQFLETPGRLVIDVRPEAGAPTPWYGSSTVIERRLPVDISADESITVTGWGRPFEAQGSWRVYRIDGLDQPLDDVPPDSLDLTASGPISTADWTTAAGEFEVTLPSLEPGVYALLFGEAPPNDDAGYIAAGQIVRIHDADVDPDALPPIPAAVWDQIVLLR